MEDREGKNFWNGRGVLDLGVEFAASTDGPCAVILSVQWWGLLLAPGLP